MSVPVASGLTYADLRLDETGHDGTPVTLAAGDTLTCLAAPGFAPPVVDVLA